VAVGVAGGSVAVLALGVGVAVVGATVAGVALTGVSEGVQPPVAEAVAEAAAGVVPVGVGVGVGELPESVAVDVGDVGTGEAVLCPNGLARSRTRSPASPAAA
jgi:hypothetical protein